MEAWRRATLPALAVCTVSLHIVAILSAQPTEELLGVVQMPGTCQRQLRSGYAARLACWAAVRRSESTLAIPTLSSPRFKGRCTQQMAASTKYDTLDDVVGCRTAEQQIQDALRLYPATAYDAAAGCVRIQVRSGL